MQKTINKKIATLELKQVELAGKISGHERECALRYEAINEKLEYLVKEAGKNSLPKLIAIAISLLTIGEIIIKVFL